MKTHTFLPVVAVLFAAFALANEVSAQLAKNTNQSRKLGSVLTGGSGNLISSNCETSFIGGGQKNAILAGSDGATVNGGARNTNSAEEFATVGGGFGNTVSAIGATVSGGRENTASGTSATVGGGGGNEASGSRSTVPGGVRCKATHDGSFVWSGWDGGDTVSVQTNSFTVRAPGGARFLSTAATNPFGLVGVTLIPGDNSWSSLSDSNSKTDFASIKPREILSKVAALPVTAWKYKHDQSRRYIGPMAQDFHAAFGLGSDDKTISTLDSDGVMYAAIQGLVEELKDRDKAIAELKAKLEVVEERLGSLPPSP